MMASLFEEYTFILGAELCYYNASMRKSCAFCRFSIATYLTNLLK